MDKNFLQTLIEEIAQAVVKKLSQPQQTPLPQRERTLEEEAEYLRQRQFEREQEPGGVKRGHS